MPSKATTISYVGEWDFENVDLWFKKKKLSEFEFVLYAQKKYGLAQADARKKYMTMAFLDETEAKRWFSHPWHYHSDMATGYRDGKMRIFDNGLVVDVENHHAFVVSEFSEKRGVPKSLFFMENGIMKEVAQKDATLNYSALLIQRENKDQGILLDAGLAKCMLARLYYFGGEGLKYFKLYKKQDDDKGNVIYVYQVLWPKEG
jgi:hypothetical protein